MRGVNTMTEARAQLEANTQRQLEAAGLQVKRLPGVTYGPLAIAQGMRGDTLFNGEMGRNANGRPYYITFGAGPAAEASFLKALEDSGSSLRVYFLHPGTAHRRLQEAGAGLDCVTRMWSQ